MRKFDSCRGHFRSPLVKRGLWHQRRRPRQAEGFRLRAVYLDRPHFEARVSNPALGCTFRRLLHAGGADIQTVSRTRGCKARGASLEDPDATHAGGFQAPPASLRAAGRRLLRPCAAWKRVNLMHATYPTRRAVSGASRFSSRRRLFRGRSCSRGRRGSARRHSGGRVSRARDRNPCRFGEMHRAMSVTTACACGGPQA